MTAYSESAQDRSLPRRDLTRPPRCITRFLVARRRSARWRCWTSLSHRAEEDAIRWRTMSRPLAMNASSFTIELGKLVRRTTEAARVAAPPRIDGVVVDGEYHAQTSIRNAGKIVKMLEKKEKIND